MNRQPRILFVGAFPKKENTAVYGGQITHCSHILASPFARHVDFILLDSTQRSIPPPGLVTRLYDAVRRFIPFMWHMVAGSIDGVLIFSANGTSLIEKGMLACVARLCGKAVLFSLLSGYFQDECVQSKYWRWWGRWVMKWPHGIIGQGAGWCTFYKQMLGVPSEKCLVIPNWIDLHRFAPARHMAHHKTQGLTFLYVGWLKKAKGVFDLLEAVSQADEAFSGHTILLCGDGGEREALQQRIQSLKGTNRVELKGWVNTDQLIEILHQVDVFVFPSHSEGLPNAVLEAMAAEVPVLTTAVGALPDFFQDEIHALIVPPRDPASLYTGMVRMATDPALRTRLSQNALQVIRHEFDRNTAWRPLSLAFNNALEATGRSVRVATSDDPPAR